MKRIRRRKDWPRDFASVPVLSIVAVPRRTECRTCRRPFAVGEEHFGVTYRGRYGRATSHICNCCAGEYVREVFTPTLLDQVKAGLAEVEERHGASCAECRMAGNE